MQSEALIDGLLDQVANNRALEPCWPFTANLAGRATLLQEVLQLGIEGFDQGGAHLFDKRRCGRGDRRGSAEDTVFVGAAMNMSCG